MLVTCSECGREFYPWRERMFEHKQATCGNPDCQRDRKTRLQRERRMKQRRSSLPQSKTRLKKQAWGNALRQRRPTLLQPPEAS